ncbi:hypothetical protein IG631_14927 [Alternaria alternata]|nr:hypothetical protein IG631_14927 [Alternaria alternata]
MAERSQLTMRASAGCTTCMRSGRNARHQNAATSATQCTISRARLSLQIWAPLLTSIQRQDCWHTAVERDDWMSPDHIKGGTAIDASWSSRLSLPDVAKLNNSLQ